jgi:hypothetical protein
VIPGTRALRRDSLRVQRRRSSAGTARDLTNHGGDQTTTGRNAYNKAPDANNKSGDVNNKAKNMARKSGS